MQPASFSTTQQELGPKSLNLSVRRQENERIHRENREFANRLNNRIRVGALPSKKGLDKEYQRHLTLKKMLMKTGKKRVPSYMGRSNHLPPLRSERVAATAGGNTAINRSVEEMGSSSLQDEGKEGELHDSLVKVNSTLNLNNNNPIITPNEEQ